MPISTVTLVVVVVCVVTVTTLFLAAVGLWLDRLAARDDGEETIGDE